MDYKELENYSFTLVEDFGKKKKGDTIKLNEVINEDDTWSFDRKGKGGEVHYLIIKHSALQTVKRLSGMVYHHNPELIVAPSIENNMSAVVSNSMKLPSNRKPRTIDVVIGEANKTSVSIPYIVTMAYKRAYDRAVIEALQLKNIYSEDEADIFAEKESVNTKLTPTDKVEIAPYLKAINDCLTGEDLDKFGSDFKKIVETGKLSQMATDEVRKAFSVKRQEVGKVVDNGTDLPTENS